MNVRRTIPPEAGQPSQACFGRNVFIKLFKKRAKKRKKGKKEKRKKGKRKKKGKKEKKEKKNEKQKNNK
jgi:hypothetical protein